MYAIRSYYVFLAVHQYRYAEGRVFPGTGLKGIAYVGVQPVLSLFYVLRDAEGKGLSRLGYRDRIADTRPLRILHCGQ